MNDTITKLVDALFCKTEMTQEAQSLRDELMANCQERYQDLLNQGRSDDEAAACVMESLKGMEEVIASYPKKQAEKDDKREFHFDGSLELDAAGFKEMGQKLAKDIKELVQNATGNRIDNEQAPEGEPVSTEQALCFLASEIDRIDCSVRAFEVSIEPCEGEQILVDVNSDENEEIIITKQDRVLSIRTRSRTKGNGWDWFASRFFAGHRQAYDIRISVPASKAVTLALHSQSGDMNVMGVKLINADLSTSSGDITLRPSLGSRLDSARVSSASGDLRLELAAQSLHCKSMSGDVDLKCDVKDLEASSISGDVSIKGRFITGRFKSTSGDAIIDSLDDSAERVDVGSTSGDVRLMLPETTQAIALTAKSVCGSVRSEFPLSPAGDGIRLNVFASSVSGDVEIVRK